MRRVDLVYTTKPSIDARNVFDRPAIGASVDDVFAALLRALSNQHMMLRDTVQTTLGAHVASTRERATSGRKRERERERVPKTAEPAPLARKQPRIVGRVARTASRFISDSAIMEDGVHAVDDDTDDAEAEAASDDDDADSFIEEEGEIRYEEESDALDDAESGRGSRKRRLQRGGNEHLALYTDKVIGDDGFKTLDSLASTDDAAEGGRAACPRRRQRRGRARRARRTRTGRGGREDEEGDDDEEADGGKLAVPKANKVPKRSVDVLGSDEDEGEEDDDDDDAGH